MMRTSTRIVAAALLLATGFAVRLPAQEETSDRSALAAEEEKTQAGSATFGGELDVTAVRVNLLAVDANGKPVPDLRANELTVFEDGEPVEALALEPSLAVLESSDELEHLPVPALTTQRTPWQVVIYTNTELAGRFQLPELLRRVADEAERLTQLGPVSVVLADPDPWTIIDATSRAETLQETLLTLADEEHGRDKIHVIRQRFIKDFRPGVGFDVDYTLSKESPSMRAARARAASKQELALVRSTLDRLLYWLETQPPVRRGLLVWVTGGFDIDPAEFYVPLVGQVDPLFGRSMRLEYTSNSLEREVARVVEIALGHGWMVMPVHSAQVNSFLYGADVAGTGRVDHHNGVGVNSIDAQASSFQSNAITYPLQVVAQATGGELVINEERLTDAVDRIRNAYFLTYQTARRSDGNIHLLQIGCSRPGVEVRYARAVASGTLKGVAAARGERLLAGEEEHGDLPVWLDMGAVQESKGDTLTGKLTIAAKLGDLGDVLAQSGKGQIRVTVVVGFDHQAPFVHHEQMPLVRTGTGDVWRSETDLRWPDQASDLAVVTEELSTGTWGAARMALPQHP